MQNVILHHLTESPRETNGVTMAACVDGSSLALPPQMLRTVPQATMLLFIFTDTDFLTEQAFSSEDTDICDFHEFKFLISLMTRKVFPVASVHP